MSHERTVILWCQKADNDLKNAHHEVEHKDPALDTVCFHAQQAAEKYLKVFLVHSKKEIPRTHIILRFIKECIAVDPAFSELLDADIDTLTDYAVDIRYVDEFFMPDVDEARNAIRKAEIVRELVLLKINTG